MKEKDPQAVDAGAAKNGGKVQGRRVTTVISRDLRKG